MFLCSIIYSSGVSLFYDQNQAEITSEKSPHNDSKIYSGMLKQVKSKKYTPSKRHHYEAVPKIHIDASIWIFGIVM